MRSIPFRFALALVLGALFLLGAPGVSPVPHALAGNQSQPVEVTPGIPVTPEDCCGAIFATFNVSFDYEGGKVLWAGSQDGTASTKVDDIANITVSGSNGTHNTSFVYGTSNPCQGVFSKGPQDITSLFSPGTNNVTVTLQDNTCGINYSSSPLWIVPGAQHYHVEFKAWIPQPRVVNPQNPTAIQYTFFGQYFPTCNPPYNPPLLQRPLTLVYSEFHGDGHSGYDGSYRVMVTADFNWDGKEIKNFTANVDNPHQYGTTTLFLTYYYLGSTVYQCQVEKTATCCTTVTQVNPTTFTLGISSGNPFFPGIAPPIYGDITGTVSADGSIQFSGKVNEFPSKAINVVLNGQTLDTDTVVDPSCLSNEKVLGVGGVRRLTIGLVARKSIPVLTVAPTDNGFTEHTNSILCTLP
jgi:hypothetical protein